jgi:pantoate--beta-alanine ligase
MTATRPAPATMHTARTVAELRAALAAPRRAGETIGLVPTMGAFHAGHLSLMRRARETCDRVVVSLFVNPSQFNDPADLDAYPRDEARDADMAAELGVDCLFAPSPEEVYPSGFATTVTVGDLTAPLEGAHRGTAHFDGVTTVVAKLFNMVGPDVAFFGQKDAQQATVIRRMVRDLDIPVRIELCPTVREPDGLALSSRNVRLNADERSRAVALNRALQAISDAIAAGERDVVRALAAGHAELATNRIDPEYLELVSPATLAPVERVGDEELLAVVAAHVGPVRLIDNHLIQPLSTHAAGSDENRRP